MLFKKKNPFISSFYFKPLIKNWLYKFTAYNWSWKNLKSKNKKQCEIALIKIPKLLLITKTNVKIHPVFITLWQHFINILNKNCQSIFFVTAHGWRYYFSTKKTINTSWQILKKIKQQQKVARTSERRKLVRLKSFYRNFGFRKNKHRSERALTRTKRFKKFKVYDQILQLSRHKKKLRQDNNYIIQSCRINGPSYYKMKKQLFCYWQRNYFLNNLTHTKLSTIVSKYNKYKKKRLLKFSSKVELTLSSLLLRTRLLKTTGMVYQFIKHGNVYVNYKKIYSPSYTIKPGDTISIYINAWKQRYHRFHDPLYTHRTMHGLYRKNTGRQSLIARERQYGFTKTSLNHFNTIDNIVTPANKKISRDILPFRAKDRIQKITESRIAINNISIANWKFSFLSSTIPDCFIQQNKYIDCINNKLA